MSALILRDRRPAVNAEVRDGLLKVLPGHVGEGNGRLAFLTNDEVRINRCTDIVEAVDEKAHRSARDAVAVALLVVVMDCTMWGCMCGCFAMVRRRPMTL